MATSTLRQVLNVFEEASGPLSLSNVAHQLDVSQGHLESMIQYWVRKGRIRETAAGKECGNCGLKGECPFVMEMPRSYELAPAHRKRLRCTANTLKLTENAIEAPHTLGR